MTAALASALHVLGLVLGFACMFARSWFLGGSLLRQAWVAVSRVADVAMMMPGGAPPAAEPALDAARMRRVLTADSLSLTAATLWVGAGVWRLTGLDKATDWYLHNDLFLLKMGLVALILALECFPMLVFIQWRYALGTQEEIARRAARGDTTPLPRGPGARLFLRGGDGPALGVLPALRRVHAVEEVLLVAILFLAPAMARGVGYDAISGLAPVSAAPCDVAALLSTRCGRCHEGPAAQGGLDLRDPAALLDVPSPTYAGAVRVRAHDPGGSLLWTKLAGPPPELGARMPLGAAPLPEAEIEAVRAWIAAGAAPCPAPG